MIIFASNYKIKKINFRTLMENYNNQHQLINQSSADLSQINSPSLMGSNDVFNQTSSDFSKENSIMSISNLDGSGSTSNSS